MRAQRAHGLVTGRLDVCSPESFELADHMSVSGLLLSLGSIFDRSRVGSPRLERERSPGLCVTGGGGGWRDVDSVMAMAPAFASE